MATKIRRSLFIGLGGTGMSALLYTKKMFMDTYGEVPPMIGFLGIDTDGSWYKKELETRKGQKVILTPSEQLPILLREDPKQIFNANRERFSWLLEENLKYLKSMRLGAGAIRTNGRFALTFNETEVARKLKTAVDEICNAKISVNPKYDIFSEDVEVHMVFSVCGGTGSGTFLNTAYLVKEYLPECKLYGYAVLPDVFESMMGGSATVHVKPNAYGSIMDLDFLMHLDMGKEPVKIEYLNRTKEVTEAPFNAVYLIDNKNDNGDVYSHIDNITEMISLALVTSTGALSGAVKSVGDNLETKMRDGGMNVKDKLGWISGFGVCEIVYNGENLKRVYSLKSIQKLITVMTNSCADFNTIANSWIDEVKIRENEGKDDVIDYITSKQAKIPFSAINTPVNAGPEIDAYLTTTALPKQKEIDEKIDALKTRIEAEFDAFIKDQINKECGVDTVEQVINSIKNQIAICMSEMKEESEDHINKQSSIVAAKDSAVSDLQNHMSKFFHRNDSMYIDAVIDAVNMLATNKREIIRHQGAISFYNWFQTILLEKHDKIQSIRKLLKSVYNDCQNEIDLMQYRVGRNSQIFSIDLATHEVGNIKLNDGEIVYTDFLKLIKLPDKIYDFDTLSSNDLKALLKLYTDSLKGSAEYGNKTVDFVLRQMDPSQRNQIIKESIAKSMPLISYNYLGQIPKAYPEEFYYVGVENANDSILVENNLFKGLCQGASDVQFSSIGVKDKIVIYRQIGVMPAFAVKSIPTFENKYENDEASNHFDYNIKRRMIMEEFSLYPKNETGKALDLWVRGLIFGLIKNEGGKYYFRSSSLGDPLDDYWVQLSNWRDESFAEFSNKIKTIEKDYDKFFDQLQSTKGTDEMQKIVDDAKLNYYDKYSQINLDRATLKKKGYEKVRALITDELNFVKDKL